jgi:hypothetical protein
VLLLLLLLLLRQRERESRLLFEALPSSDPDPGMVGFPCHAIPM